jgi:manganese/zinc/iron transport system permease protein
MLAEYRDLLLLMAAVGAACAVPGVFLVLRRTAMVADAISHVLLFGIVATFLVVRDADSPWLYVGAAASGVLTVALVEALQRTKRLKADAAIGLVFPLLFSVGALLATLYMRNTHLDVDRVLLGNPTVSPFDRLVVFGVDLGPRSLAVLLGLFALNAGLVAAFYKELKLSTFDAALAATLGFLPGLLHYGLMTMVSVTAVAAFDAVGPVVVVALFVVPAATAYLLTDRLAVLLPLSVVFAVASAVAGTLLAIAANANVAGAVATLLGGVFAVAFVVAPHRGLLAHELRRIRQRRAFHETMLAIHLYQHEGTPVEVEESRDDGLHRHLHWLPGEVKAVTARAERNGLVTRAGPLWKLTPAGRDLAAATFGQ